MSLIGRIAKTIYSVIPVNTEIWEKCCLRKCNIYLDTVAVSEERTIAEIYSREISWDIWRVLKEAGAKGMTAKEIAENFRVTPAGVKPERFKYPMSTIYQALDNMKKAALVESTSRAVLPWGRPPKEAKKRVGRDRNGRPLTVYTLDIADEPMDYVDKDFYDALEPVLEKYVPQIEEAWMAIMEKIMLEFSNDELKEFLPQDEIHPNCDLSHEGVEFLRAISYGILQFIEERSAWEDFAIKHKIMKDAP